MVVLRVRSLVEVEGGKGGGEVVVADSWFGGLGGWFFELVVDGCCVSSM